MSRAASAKLRLVCPPSREICSLSSSAQHIQTIRSVARYCLGPTRPAGLMPLCVCMSCGLTLEIILQGGGDVDVPVLRQIPAPHHNIITELEISNGHATSTALFILLGRACKLATNCSSGGIKGSMQTHTSAWNISTVYQQSITPFNSFMLTYSCRPSHLMGWRRCEKRLSHSSSSSPWCREAMATGVPAYVKNTTHSNQICVRVTSKQRYQPPNRPPYLAKSCSGLVCIRRQTEQASPQYDWSYNIPITTFWALLPLKSSQSMIWQARQISRAKSSLTITAHGQVAAGQK